MKYYLYVLECSNDSFYIGYTIDIKQRYREHCTGTIKSKYTRSFPPKRLAACWSFNTEKGIILSIEKKLKQLTRAQKLELMTNRKLLSQYTQYEFIDETGDFSSDINV